MSEPARLTLGRGESRSALLNQLCAGGARVKLSQRLQPGAVVDLDFKTGAGDHHHLHARVVHVLKEDRGYNYHCGLCFVETDAQAIQRLADYVEEERKRREVGFAMPRV
ncbi:MAG: PilZ domain-containing protein [Candidatus Eremiobacteraeota bacterium]|nr:PilZ domain-containing protein [Candidatus Eremiobacteraeota bacterium]